MVSLKINNRSIEVPEGTTILDATRLAGCPVPTLCYLKGINEIAACRVCIVEIKGIDHLVTSCNNAVTEGMEVYTNTAKVREARKTNVELIMSQHHTNCPSCVRSGTCQLQKIANSLNFVQDTYKIEPTYRDWDKSFPLIKDASKCIKCMRCIQVCDKIQGLNIWDVTGTGSYTGVDVSLNRVIRNADCSLCGQCITHCPTAALQERDDTAKLTDMDGALNDPDKITVVQVAPAVRAAWGETFGLSPEFATEGRLAAALRRLGFNYVFDTNFSADLTIMEEGTEFLARLNDGEEHRYPMFTSCCPGWVRFLKSQYPDMVGDLSSAKSPQQMFGAVAKTYFAQKIGCEPQDITCVSIMPCLAKKEECDLPTMYDSGVKDVDYVLTTRELCRMIKADQIDVSQLEEEGFDSPLGTGSGAGVIFGATGGVMEAALRTCYAIVMGENPPADAFKAVRGTMGWKEANFELGGRTIRTAVVSGLANTRRMIRALRAGEVSYDFVEVMACPGGCAGGGGQPIHDGCELAGERGAVLYHYDECNPLRFSHENPEVQALYADFLGEPNGEKAHHLLHTDHTAWDIPLTPHPDTNAVL
ncbi:MAG: [FeFe] hydrogenase, group A [Clostridiales bacterium]|nr:[FeFe] hydrogenase, group A [Clostridiales bacterium]